MPELPQYEVFPEELHAQLQGEHSVRLIDCREQDEWHICHIQGAQLVPLSQFAELAERVLGPDKEQHLIVYCHHGVRSMHATQWLRRAGYQNTQSLHGGIDLWAEMIDTEMRRY
jgi:adenylyltransferase/sulfurtransferase